MLFLAGGVLIGWLAGAVISYVVAFVAKGIWKLIKLIRSATR